MTRFSLMSFRGGERCPQRRHESAVEGTELTVTMRSSGEMLELPAWRMAPAGKLRERLGESMADGPVAERVLATVYALIHDAVFRSFGPYQALLREVLEDGGRSVHAGGKVLELGSGTGNFSLALGERGYAVVGEDPFERLVARARGKADARRLANVTFRSGPGTDGGYDLVLSVHVLYAHPDPVAELGRAFQRLRRGGHAIIVNFARRAPVVATVRFWMKAWNASALLRWRFR